MPVHDFDFQRYVERRKGARDAEQREGSAYAYAGDLRIRRLLARARPVTLALSTTVKLWQATARAQLLGTTVRITERSYPRVWKAAEVAAARLHVTLPPLHASPQPGIGVNTFGADDDPVVLLHAELCDALSDAELTHAIGTELGRIQNGGALLGTAHYFLHRAPEGFVRWIVGPARAGLALWWRRAAITADRAGLLCARDLAAAESAMRRVALAESTLSDAPDGAHRQGPADPADLGDPVDSGATTDAPPDARFAGSGRGRAGATFASPEAAMLAARVGALEAFSRSSYYLGLLGEPGGTSPDDTDKRVAALLKAAGKGQS
jgi:hypothetical protein